MSFDMLLVYRIFGLLFGNISTIVDVSNCRINMMDAIDAGWRTLEEQTT